jgi:ATP-dependent Clp endopeptidase proteolytic subunit ClpP
MTDTPSEWDSQLLLNTKGVFTVFGEINSEICEQIVQFIMAHNLVSRPKTKNITLVINSEGGSLLDAFAVIDVIRNSAVPVHTLGIGQISSAALMIFMAGQASHRVITQNTSILSHQWDGSFSGKLHELMSMKTDMELTQARVIQHYQTCSGLSTEQIQKLLLPPHDVFLSAAQAVEYGIADRIQ